MSQVTVKGNAGGTGVFTLQSPNSNNSRTLTLPDVDGSLLASDAIGNFQFNSGYGSVATAYGCRAWVNFNGSTGSVNGSGNVSSVTVNSTGNYTVNFTNAMPDANYAVAGWAPDSNNGGSVTIVSAFDGSTYSTTAVQIVAYETSASISPRRVCLIVMR